MPTVFCSVFELVILTIFSIICIGLECIVVYIFYRLIAERNNIVAEMSKTSQRLGILFVIATFLWIATHSSAQWLEFCFLSSDFLWDIWSTIATLLYVIQTFILLIIFFEKLTVVFEGTQFIVSSFTKTMYKIIFSFIPIGTIIAISLYQSKLIFSIFAGILLFMFISLMISLVILFVFKLIQVYKQLGMNADDNKEIHGNKSVVSAITKTTILTSTSIIITFLNGIVAMIRLNNPNNAYLAWIANLFVLLDVYTNFLCVIMCYKAFGRYYKNFCKCFDIKCRKCWVNIIYAGNCCDEDLMTQMHTVISHESNNTTSSKGTSENGPSADVGSVVSAVSEMSISMTTTDIVTS